MPLHTCVNHVLASIMAVRRVGSLLFDYPLAVARAGHAQARASAPRSFPRCCPAANGMSPLPIGTSEGAVATPGRLPGLRPPVGLSEGITARSRALRTPTLSAATTNQGTVLSKGRASRTQAAHIAGDGHGTGASASAEASASAVASSTRGHRVRITARTFMHRQQTTSQ